MAVKSPTDRLDEILTFFQISRAQLAQTLGVPEQAVDRWATGRGEPRGVNLRELGRLGELMDLLLQVKGSTDAAQAWLAEPNAAFGGSSPMQIVLTRGPLQVLNYLEMPDEPAYA